MALFFTAIFRHFRPMGAAAGRIAIGAAVLAVAAVLAHSDLSRVAPAAAPPTTVDRLLVDKSDPRLELWSGDAVVRSYETSLGFAPAR